jgi:hypothetical protein
MASTIKIKRSEVSGNPSTLGAGELAYSALPDNGSNGGDRLYVGMGTETNGNAVNHVVIGGKYFTDMVSAATALNTPNTLVKRNANGSISANITGSITGNADTASAWLVPRTLSLTGDGTASLLSVDGSDDVNATFTLATVNSNVGSYGSSTAIPIITVNEKGLVTGVSTASITTSLNISGDSGSDVISLADDTLSFVGGQSIETTVNSTSNVVTISNKIASNSVIGVAKFNSNSFDVNSGDVTIKTGGISNTQLANSDVTFGTTTVSLGGTSTSLTGLTELSVDNLNINGNQIESTNANGDIVINPIGTGSLDVSGSKIINLAEPIEPTDAATKYYVDNAVSGLSWKDAINLLAINNVTLTGSTSTLVIDGHSALDVTDNNVYRILLIGQNTVSENGIYVYTDNGTSYSLVRAQNSDTYQELIGASVYVLEGVEYAATGWVQSNHYLSSFAGQTWVQFSGAGAYSAGAGLGQTGTQFFVNVASNGGLEITNDAIQLTSTIAGAGLTLTNGILDITGTTDRISVGTEAIDIASTYVGQTSITTVGEISVGTWKANVIGTEYGGTGLSSYSTGDLLFASNSTTLSTLSAAAEGKVLLMGSLGVPVWGDIDGGTY